MSKGLPYYFNSQTKQSSWDPPQGLTEEEIKQLPGAKEYLSQSGGGPGGDANDKVRASHLLVKHRDSRRPSSWKEVCVALILIRLYLKCSISFEQPNISRTKEESIAILRDYQAQINGSADKFAKLASEHSDCSSYSKGGDLGWFGRGQMQKPFEDATFALSVGQMSDVISTDSGVHLILRTG